MKFTKLQQQNERVTALIQLDSYLTMIHIGIALVIYLAKDITVGESFKFASQFTSRLKEDLGRDDDQMELSIMDAARMQSIDPE